jgi:hypothetical protein
VGVDTEEERSVDALVDTVAANGLGDGEDVRLVERSEERRSPVTLSAEGDSLPGDRRVGRLGVIGAHQPGHVGQQ